MANAPRTTTTWRPPTSSNCTLQYYHDMDTGVIVSPGYNEANNYPNDADCSWEIRVGDGKVVQLTFVEFELENK